MDDEPADKAGTPRTRTTRSVRLRGAPRRYVSRGGDKLAGALDDLGLDVARRGAAWTSAPRPAASPTACCSAARAAWSRSTSGYGQLALAAARGSARRPCSSGTNARDARARPTCRTRPTWSCADVSFISLRLLLPADRSCVARARSRLLLVKPQFEVGRDQVGKGRRRARRRAARAGGRGSRRGGGRARLSDSWPRPRADWRDPRATGRSSCTSPRA